MTSNRIHPTAVIDGNVELGTGNVLMPYSVIAGPCVIGDGNWIGHHAVVGSPAQHPGEQLPDADGPQGAHGVVVGSGNVLREYVTVHQGLKGSTVVGDGVYLMAHSHVPHDAVIGDGVTLANSVQVAGHTRIGRGSNLGLGVAVHQRLVLGAYVMVGMNSTVTRDIPPFALAYGNPARITGANRVGMLRAGFDPDEVDLVDAHYRAATDAPNEEGLSERATELLEGYAERVRERDRR